MQVDVAYGDGGAGFLGCCSAHPETTPETWSCSAPGNSTGRQFMLPIWRTSSVAYWKRLGSRLPGLDDDEDSECHDRTREQPKDRRRRPGVLRATPGQREGEPRGTQRHEHDPEVIDDRSASAASGRHGGRG